MIIKINKKNLILTMLACLNCVHTTHAVEKAVDFEYIFYPAQKKIEEAMTEGLLKKKAVHYRFQDECFNAGHMINDPDMMQDASVQAAQILLDMTTKLKDKIPHTDPDWPVIEAVENVRRDIVNDLKKADIEKPMQYQPVYRYDYRFGLNGVSDYMSALFNEKLGERVKAGKIPGLTVDMVNMALDCPYESALYSRILHLNCASCLPLMKEFLPTNFPFDHSLVLLLRIGLGANEFESEMTDLQTHLKNNYPDMVQPVWDIYKKAFRHQLNDYIRGNRYRFNDGFDIGKAIEQYLLNKPGIKQVTDTILDTIRQNLNLDEDTDLHKWTVTELDRSKTLRRLVSNYIQQEKMSMVKTMKHKEQAKAPFKKVAKNVFQEVGKYLGTQDSSNNPTLGKRTRSDQEVNHDPAKRQRT